MEALFKADGRAAPHQFVCVVREAPARGVEACSLNDADSGKTFFFLAQMTPINGWREYFLVKCTKFPFPCMCNFFHLNKPLCFSKNLHSPI
jgi:hypothetical protein